MSDSSAAEAPNSDFNEEMFIEWSKAQVRKARNDRIPFERQWYLNLAFFFGRQWVTWIGGSTFDYARLFEPRRRSWQVRLTTNKIRPRALKMVAKLSQEKPRGFVLPNSTDDDDIVAARAAETILEYVSENQTNQDQILREADFWSVVCGTSFIKDWFDDTVVDPAGGIGLIKLEALSPFHIFIPSLEDEDIDNQPWVCHVATKTVEWVRATHGVELEPTTSYTASVLNDRFLHGLGINQNTARDAVIVYEMWIKPGTSKHIPEGGKITWSQDRVLDISRNKASETEAPAFLHGNEYPFTRRVQTPTGRFYGETPVTDMVPLQMEYNRGRSQVIEARNRAAKPMILAPRGSVDARRITAEPGLVVTYEPALNPPMQMELQPLPSYVMQDLQLIERDLDELASQGEISRGDAPGRVEAATAIAFLQEEQDAVISLATDNKELAIQRIGKHSLTYVSTFWDATRTINVSGRNQQFESYVFSKTDVKSNVNFHVVAGSARPLSRSGKQALILDLLKQGAIPVGKGLQYLQLGDAAKLWEELQIDTRQSERENVRMIQGVQTPVNDFDDDIVHIQVHDDYRKRQEYETLSDESKTLLRVHVFRHLHQLAIKNNLVPQMDPAQMQNALIQMQQDPTQIDPILEGELRRIYEMILKAGSMPAEPVQSGGGEG